MKVSANVRGAAHLPLTTRGAAVAAWPAGGQAAQTCLEYRRSR